MMEHQSALSGIRVLDLSRVLAGPFCTQILGDLGADVIKVERPNVGDDTRYWGPPFLSDGTAAYFTCANRNKRAITVDIKSDTGRDIIYRLAANSDIFIENFKTGDMANLGLSYEKLAQINPKLIYCSITGFGQTGPRAQEAGYDFLIQAMGGLMSITGHPQDPEGMKTGVAVVDLFTGLWASVAILAALQAREKTGLGQYIDLALFDCQLSMLANVAANYFVSHKRPGRYANAHANIVPYQTFTASDGPFALALGNDKHFATLCAALGHEDLAQRFPTNRVRIEQRESCIGELSSIFKQMSREEIIALCNNHGLPAGPINCVDEAFNDLQALNREMKLEMLRADGVTVPMVASPIKMEPQSVSYRSAPPRLGEHTQEVLLEHGFSHDEIAIFEQAKVI